MSDAARAFLSAWVIDHFQRGEPGSELVDMLDAFAAKQMTQWMIEHKLHCERMTAQVRQEVESVLLADEQTIERLTAQVERLRAMMRKVSMRTRHAQSCEHNDEADCSCLARRDELAVLIELGQFLLADPTVQATHA